MLHTHILVFSCCFSCCSITSSFIKVRKCLLFSSQVLQEHCKCWNLVSGHKGPRCGFRHSSLAQVCLFAPQLVGQTSLLTGMRWNFLVTMVIVAYTIHPHPASHKSWGLAVANPWQLDSHVFTLKAAGIKGGGEHGKLQMTPLGRQAVCISS